jgi:hypothetical protein
VAAREPAIKLDAAYRGEYAASSPQPFLGRGLAPLKGVETLPEAASSPLGAAMPAEAGGFAWQTTGELRKKTGSTGAA